MFYCLKLKIIKNRVLFNKMRLKVAVDRFSNREYYYNVLSSRSVIKIILVKNNEKIYLLIVIACFFISLKLFSWKKTPSKWLFWLKINYAIVFVFCLYLINYLLIFYLILSNIIFYKHTLFKSKIFLIFFISLKTICVHYYQTLFNYFLYRILLYFAKNKVLKTVT